MGTETVTATEPVLKTSARELRCTMIEPGTDDQAVTFQRDENAQLYKDLAGLTPGSEVKIVPNKEGEKLTIVFDKIPEYAALHLHEHLNTVFGAGVDAIWVTRGKMTLVLSGMPTSMDAQVDAYIASIEPEGRKDTVEMRSSRGDTDVPNKPKGPMTLAEHRKQTGGTVVTGPTTKDSREAAAGALKKRFDRR